MKTTITIVLGTAMLVLGGCAVTPTPQPVVPVVQGPPGQPGQPGPAGDPGATGQTGEQGKAAPCPAGQHRRTTDAGAACVPD